MNPETPPVPIIRHTDVRRMLLQAKAYAEGGTAVTLYAAKLLDISQAADSEQERAEAELLLDVLTPVVKSWPSQWSQAAADHAIQIHGGAGYTRDFPLEQFYRDNRLNAIHEGTHGIQANDLLGRKVRMRGGAGFSALLERMRATCAAATPANAESAALVARRVDRLEAVTAELWKDGDAVTALANASHYLEAAGDTIVAWLLLDQVGSLGDRSDAFAEGKRATTRYFITHVLPRADAQFDLLASRDRQLVEIDEELI